MSIQEQIVLLKEEARLVPLQPLISFAPAQRTVLLTHDLDQAFRNPDEFPIRYDAGVLRSDLEIFVNGGVITFATGREKKCLMKALDPLDEEVWEFRSRGEKPGARVFGRFALPDVFVATGMTDRDDMDFDVEIRRCKAAWRALFTTYPPFSGSSPSDYITRNLLDLRTI